VYSYDCWNWGTLCTSEDIITCEECPHYVYRETNVLTEIDE